MTNTTNAAVEGKDPIGTEMLLNFLDIELTERCNQNCHHCYIRLPSNDHGAISSEMDFAFICRVLQEAVELGCTKIRFTGGEPLIRKDFADIYNYSHILGLSVSVATNATLITEDIADLLAQKPPTCVSISIYGWDEASYRSVTQVPGAFHRFVTGTKRLQQRGLPILIRYPPLQILVQNSGKLRSLAQELGATYPVPYSWELTLHARNNLEDSRRIKSLRLTPKAAAQERLKEPGRAKYIRELLQSGVACKKTNKLFSCAAARKRPTLNAYGQLQVCLQVRHPYTLYDLRTGSLRDALTLFFPQMRRLQNTNPRFLERCIKCLLRAICPHCPAISWMEHGTLDEPADYYCDIVHEEARLLGFLVDGERGWLVETLKTPTE